MNLLLQNHVETVHVEPLTTTLGVLRYDIDNAAKR